MQYLYCFVRGVENGAPLPYGFGGKQVRLLSAADISALVSENSPLAAPREIASVLVHQQVVYQALELSRSIIPCRFGIWVADEASILSLLQKNASLLNNYLTQLEGKLEVEIQAIFETQQAKERTTRAGLTAGEQYLLTKKERYDGKPGLSVQGQKLARELKKATSPFWVMAKTEEQAIQQKRLLRLFCLVEKKQLSSFRRAYTNLNRTALKCKLLYSGPWPPYSFAEVHL